VKFAYADPPYLGLAAKFYGHLHPDAADYDKPETHQALIDRMTREYDGWAMSLHSPSLRQILPMCPSECRVMAWVKPFASFKPNVGVAYAWEPIIVLGGRKRGRNEATVRDWCAENITLRRGFTGAKPAAVVHWLLDVLGAEPTDEVDDLFPGSGAVSRVIDEWKQAASGACTGPLFTACAVCGELGHQATCDSPGSLVLGLTGCPVHDAKRVAA
jgi:hypothetical protein